MPVSPSDCYSCAKRASVWSSAIILEHARTGGYPSVDETQFVQPSGNFPRSEKELRDYAAVCAAATHLFASRAGGFSLGLARKVAHVEDIAIRKRGDLYRAFRAVRETEMHEPQFLAKLAQVHLAPSQVLGQEVLELHRICATIRFRGKAPGAFLVRGHPRNPADQQFIMAKLRGCARQG